MSALERCMTGAGLAVVAAAVILSFSHVRLASAQNMSVDPALVKAVDSPEVPAPSNSRGASCAPQPPAVSQAALMAQLRQSAAERARRKKGSLADEVIVLNGRGYNYRGGQPETVAPLVPSQLVR